MADHNPDRIILWPGYFNAKLSRKQGRRVSKEAAVTNPTLDSLALAARNVGLTKMKREADTPHPKRASQKEGRLWLSKKDLSSTLGTTSKEEAMQAIGAKWRGQQHELKEQEEAAKKAGPKTGDVAARTQRKQRGGGKQRRGQRKQKKWKL